MRSPQAQNRRILKTMSRDNNYYNTGSSSTVQRTKQPRIKKQSGYSYKQQSQQQPQKSRLDIMNDLLVSTNDNIRSEIMKYDFLEYSLVNGNIIIVLNVEDILREYELEQGYLTNNIFDNIRCEKVGIVYSPKLKMFLYLALNNDPIAGIMFKSKDLSELPNIDRIDLKLLPIDSHIVENANRLMISNFSEIVDLCHNPVLIYKVGELFKRI